MNIKSARVDSEVFTCWKDIARYMGKGVRTVQRWEEKYGLPVQRPLGVTSKTSVIVRRHDLDMWLEERWSDRQHRQNGSHVPREDPVITLGAQIRTARELRSANRELIREISAVLHSLVQNCDQLIAQRGGALQVKENSLSVTLPDVRIDTQDGIA